MNQPTMEFEEFKKEYMSNFDGYIPTYITADEQYNEKGTIMLGIEMIAPFRMTDGPSRFFRVVHIIVNEEQYSEIKGYFILAGEHWKYELAKKVIDCLEYSNNFKKRK